MTVMESCLLPTPGRWVSPVEEDRKPILGRAGVVVWFRGGVVESSEVLKGGCRRLLFGIWTASLSMKRAIFPKQRGNLRKLQLTRRSKLNRLSLYLRHTKTCQELCKQIKASVSSDPWRQVMQADHKQDNDVCVQLT
ncbi:hypothetical protein AV530_006033 [Patagioenas fasciata monilis]|uniref:Uncharacterized protein n=1 Tax=Patagioenas fasciata monilis TaxID=372326 RepID=A0A1V4J9C0_PATFA|nr:hypothetical protein AV530_006033 [Patagioenas fasciata monilis]